MVQITDRVDQLAVLQGQTELTLQTFMRRMDNEIQRIWEQIQEILTTIRNRFPGNGKGN
jgi:nitrate/nitrite-specific signal transduction histidine kinase